MKLLAFIFLCSSLSMMIYYASKIRDKYKKADAELDKYILSKMIAGKKKMSEFKKELDDDKN